MDMTVDQTRAEEIALHIDGLSGSIVSETYDHPSENGHILSFDLTREDVHHPSVFDQEISHPIARSDPDFFF
jgi:hypothetical protein